jgi:sugar diacid utilization regulator
VDSENLEELRDTMRKGELLITKFQIIHDQPDLIVDYLKVMINEHASGLLLKSTYYDTLPEEALALADAEGFPVFVFDDVFIDEIIIDINNALQDSAREDKNEALIEEMLHEGISGDRVRHLATILNHQFREHFIVSYVKSKDLKLEGVMDGINFTNMGQVLGSHSSIVKYHGGYLLIVSTDKRGMDQLDKTIKALVQNDDFANGAYAIGQCAMKHNIEYLGQGIKEALHANEFALMRDQALVAYDEIGIYQLLLDIKGHKRVTEHYMPYITALKEHDKLNDTDLLATAIALVKAEGDIKQTAEDLFQHANTVRYRLKRIAKIMGGDQMKGIVYENLALVIRLYLLSEENE